MVFWHGTTYNMNLVTENGRWVGDQSAEAPPEENGCIEHMSDKQARYSHVRLLENNPARIVVHWRYAMTDVLYNIGESDPITGWGDWVDEYYTIYPDGLAVRHFLIHAPRKRYSITEPATLNNPGEKAEDNVSIEALTLENMEGVARSYSWETWPSNGDVRGRFFNEVPDANISIMNTKSDFKPLVYLRAGHRNHSLRWRNSRNSPVVFEVSHLEPLAGGPNSFRRTRCARAGSRIKLRDHLTRTADGQARIGRSRRRTLPDGPHQSAHCQGIARRACMDSSPRRDALGNKFCERWLQP